MINLNNKYALYYKGHIITHSEYKIVYIKYNKEFYIEFDNILRVIKIYLNPGKELERNNNIYRLAKHKRKKEILEEGRYDLYPIFYLNNNPCIVSKLLYENMFSIFYIRSDILKENSIKKVPKLKTSTHFQKKLKEGDDHYLILLKDGYLKRHNIDKGININTLNDSSLIEFLRNSNLIYPIKESFTDKANFKFIRLSNSKNNKIISKDIYLYEDLDQEIYLSGQHYADLVIRTLAESYKEIHFFNTPGDWGKEKNWDEYSKSNNKDYREFIRFTVGTEDFSRARRDFHSNFGPVLFNAKIDINFEYATADTETFLRRRTDLILGQFITYYTHDSFSIDADLLGDNSNITGFPIHWVLDEAMYGENTLQRSSEIIDDQNLSLHSMRFKCELYVRVLRFCKKTPPILKLVWKILGEDNRDIVTHEDKLEADEEEKKLIMERYSEGKYFKEDELKLLKKYGAQPSDVNNVEYEVDIINKKYADGDK